MHIRSQLQKTNTHYQALKEYYEYIQNIDFDFSVKSFERLKIEQRAVLEAYLKRFASLQDYLGAKVFRSLLDIAGISYTKMSEVLTLIEKEEIIDLDLWIEFRNIRNDLEHDYPDELEDALNDLKRCVNNYDKMHSIVVKVFEFARRYGEGI
jgi:hypothetical protein